LPSLTPNIEETARVALKPPILPSCIPDF